MCIQQWEGSSFEAAACLRATIRAAHEKDLRGRIDLVRCVDMIGVVNVELVLVSGSLVQNIVTSPISPSLKRQLSSLS